MPVLYTSCAAGSRKSSGPVPMNSGEDMSNEHPVVPGMYLLGPAAPQQLGLQPTYFCTRSFAAAEALRNLGLKQQARQTLVQTALEPESRVAGQYTHVASPGCSDLPWGMHTPQTLPT